MQLDDYFEFLNADDIRIKGHRIGIDDVLSLYLDGYTAEEIAANLPSLSLEEIYATITYYLRNRTAVDAYLSRLAAWRDQRQRESDTQTPAVVQRLRALRSRTTHRHSAAQ